MDQPRSRFRWTLRALMLAVALSAIVLALGLAIRDEIEASRRSQFPWKQVQAASAKARRAAAGQGSK